MLGSKSCAMSKSCDSEPEVGAQPELIYFDTEGRAELTRTVFKAGNIAFADTRVGDDWPKIKTDPKTGPGRMFGSVPVIVHGDFTLAQPAACAQYAADVGLNTWRPPTAAQRSLDTMTLGVHTDLVNAGAKTRFGPDDKKAEALEAFPGRAAALLAGLERQFKGTGAFLHAAEGEAPSLGDVAIFSVLPGLKSMGIDLSAYPKLEACVAACQQFLDGSRPLVRTLAPATQQMPAAGDLELMYFDTEGRAEVTRLALHAGGVPFKDTRVAGADWPALKTDPTSLPGRMFGSMPVLKLGDHEVAQSTATAQFAADLGINTQFPKTAAQRAIDFMMLNVLEDALLPIYAVLSEKDQAAKLKLKRALPEKLDPVLSGVERLYRGPSSFLYAQESQGPSLGDLVAFFLIVSISPLEVDLSPYPKTVASVDAVKATTIPSLKAYLEAKDK